MATSILSSLIYTMIFIVLLVIVGLVIGLYLSDRFNQRFPNLSAGWIMALPCTQLVSLFGMASIGYSILKVMSQMQPPSYESSIDTALMLIVCIPMIGILVGSIPAIILIYRNLNLNRTNWGKINTSAIVGTSSTIVVALIMFICSCMVAKYDMSLFIMITVITIIGGGITAYAHYNFEATVPKMLSRGIQSKQVISSSHVQSSSSPLKINSDDSGAVYHGMSYLRRRDS